MYNGPTIAAAEVTRLYETGRDTVRILDVAAGTGFLGAKVQLPFKQGRKSKRPIIAFRVEDGHPSFFEKRLFPGV